MTPPSGHEIVTQLIALRISQRLTQADIASRCGVNHATIARFETETHRHRSPSLYVLQRYAHAVGAQITLEILQ